MKLRFKVVFIFSILAFTASCQDQLDTSSSSAKERSIEKMMVDIHPHNQKAFKQALNTIYEVDQKINTDISIAEANALTDKRLQGKTIEEILHLSFISKKLNVAHKSRSNVLAYDSFVVKKKLDESAVIIKTQYTAK